MKNQRQGSVDNICAVKQLEWEKQAVKAFAFLTGRGCSADNDRLEAFWAVAGNAALIAVNGSQKTGDAIQVLHTMSLEKIAEAAEGLAEEF